MRNKQVKPTTPGRRHYTGSTRARPLPSDPPRSLLKGPVKKRSGRNSSGRITVRHRGGGQKRILRLIDWKRNKRDIPARVERIEYDPNRSAHLALLLYSDGERRYILAPVGLKVGDQVLAGEKAPVKPGNALPIAKIPAATPIHNLELRLGKGGQLVRGAGTAAMIQSKEGRFVKIKLPSGELRRFDARLQATVGQVGNEAHKTRKLGKAGRRRWLGWRPAVRGVAMNPRNHPHGGGEGRSGIGMKGPKTPWGKRTLGKKTRKKKKYSDKYIIMDQRVR